MSVARLPVLALSSAALALLLALSGSLAAADAVVPKATATTPDSTDSTVSTVSTDSTTDGTTQARRVVPAKALPERLNLHGARQVIVVTSNGWSTSLARLQAWQLGRNDGWRQVMAPARAHVGWNGFAPTATRVQNSGETPAGSFRLLRGFGVVDPGGVDLPYQVIDANDWWPYDPTDPKTYNVMQLRRPKTADWRTSWAEDLDSYRTQYRYAVVLDYNLPSGIVRTDSGERIATQPANTAKGGGIFLHVNGSGATAGCVSVSRANMRWLMRWLRPGAQPRIVMGPRGTLQ